MLIKKLKLIINKSIFSLLIITAMLSTTAFAETTSVNNLNDLKQKILNNMLQRNSSFIINYTGNTTELQSQLSNLIKEAYSTDDYLKWSWKNYNVSLKGTSGNVDISFAFNFYLTKEQEDYVDQQSEAIVSELITEDMSDFEKVKVLNDYVVNLLDYDYSLQKRTAYDALVEKKVVCQGYANLLDKLLEKAGIESILVGGSLAGTPHAWNLVKVDGNWYHVDATNNDSNRNKYFLVSDSFLSQNRFVWDTNSYPKALNNYQLPGNPTISPEVETATNLVVKAEQTKSAYDISQAEKAITLISDATIKEQLTQRINRVKFLIVADNTAKYVVQAEKSLRETDLTRAYTEVNKLADSEEKSGLLQRLGVVKQTIENKKIETATNLVIKAEQVRTTSNVSQAEKAIALISDATIKEQLTQRINRVKFLISVDNTAKYVVQAEKSLRETDLTRAYTEVNKLADSEEKSELLQRLDVVKQTIEDKKIETATNLVIKAEQVRTTSNVSQAEKAIVLISDTTIKEQLTQRINKVKFLIVVDNTAKYVVQAEKSLRETDLTRAYTEVNKLADSEEKSGLLQRLDVVKQTIENKKIETATNLVIKAEQVRTTSNISQAEKAIALISDATIKEQLTQRINRVKFLITVDNATKYVVQAEKTLKKLYFDSAVIEVNKLIDSQEKNELLQRLLNIQSKVK